MISQPLHLLLICLAGWINREQQQVIDYLQTENRILKEKLGKKRILLNDDQRKRLAIKGKFLGRKLLEQIATIVTPDTILRWHKQLIATKWDFSDRRRKIGRPRIRQAIIEQILRFSNENPTWGYERIQGALKNVGYNICASTVANVLKDHGVEPTPDRLQKTRWKEFLKAHWESLIATDFFSVEVWTNCGLITHYVLFVIELSTRRIQITGITRSPDNFFMANCARNLTDEKDGLLRGGTILLHDRDTKFTKDFRDILKDADVKTFKLPPYSPNLNAYAERFVKSIKTECTDKMIFFGYEMLCNTINEYQIHYNFERNHQGINNELIEPPNEIYNPTNQIICKERLGGILKYYHRKAA